MSGNMNKTKHHKIPLPVKNFGKTQLSLVSGKILASSLFQHNLETNI